VISDHVRALTFAIADGGIISNEGRGYVLRRILRRAARHGRLLGLHEPFLYKIVQPLVDTMGGHFGEIRAKQAHIELVIRSEEEQFGRTLDTGLEIFDLIVEKAEFRGQKIIPGFEVFRLYDTFGFPVDLTEIMARERGFGIDIEGFEKELERQRERSKSNSKFEFSDSAIRRLSFDRSKSSKFVGYDKTQIATTLIDSIFDNGEWKVILAETPFYAESGGQIGDTGVIESKEIDFESPMSFIFIVTDTQNVHGDIVHIGKFKKAPNFVLDEDGKTFNTSEKVLAHIDMDRRADIKRNHTATHLLHKALRMALGEHVHQAGSLVAQDRLRFDFTHFKAMAAEELDRVEDIIIEKIHENLTVYPIPDVPLEKAKEMGAMALFGEKYGDKVRVVVTGESPNPFSLELCGGTHVSQTDEIGKFFITQETAIAAGMRRIEAITGTGAAKFLAEQESLVSEVRNFLRTDIGKLAEDEISRFKSIANTIHRRIQSREKLTGPIQEFQDRIEKHLREKEKQAQGKLSQSAQAFEPQASMRNGMILVFKVPAGDAGDLMVYADSFKKTYAQSAVLTISELNGGFAITSADTGLGKDVFQELAAVSGGRGGGQGTIRGTMPPEKIEAVIDSLKRKFGE
jgi:alanyl-tRNA synthetase